MSQVYEMALSLARAVKSIDSVEGAYCGRKLPVAMSGVYVLFDKNEIVYVGESKHVLRRIGEHLRGANKKKYDSFMIFPCGETDRKYGEQFLIDTFQPKYNVKNTDAYTGRGNTDCYKDYDPVSMRKVFHQLFDGEVIEDEPVSCFLKPEGNDADLCTIKEAARRTGLSVYIMRQGIKAGTVPHIKSGNKFYVNMNQLNDMLKQGKSIC